MKFRIETLIDITETQAKRSEGDQFAYRQESNFQTVLQTIGLRVNLLYEKSPEIKELALGKMGFGDKYKGKQKFWTFDFVVEHEHALTLDMLATDFDLIPIIIGLNETVAIDKALFRTTPQERNIIFSIVD
jgi:hypothetical protein